MSKNARRIFLDLVWLFCIVSLTACGKNVAEGSLPKDSAVTHAAITTIAAVSTSDLFAASGLAETQISVVRPIIQETIQAYSPFFEGISYRDEIEKLPGGRGPQAIDNVELLYSTACNADLLCLYRAHIQWTGSPQWYYFLFSLDDDSTDSEGIQYITSREGDQEIGPEYMLWSMYYDIMDIDMSLFIDASELPYGALSDDRFIGLPLEERVLKTVDMEPIYHSGDYWRMIEYDNLVAYAYCTSDVETGSVMSIKTSRADVHTYRGIRLGSTRQEVIAAYSDGYLDPPGEYEKPEADYLEFWKGYRGTAAKIRFTFQDDRVAEIWTYLRID